MTKEKPNSLYLGVALGASGVADVERFFSGLKIVCGLAAMVVWVVVIFKMIEPSDPSDRFHFSYEDILGKFGYGYFWGGEASWSKTYYDGCLEREWYGCTSETTPSEFLLILIADKPVGYLKILIFFALFITLAFGYFFLRRPAPVRFNRNLGAIYTWHRGKLWIHPQYIFDYEDKLGLDLLGSGGFNGPMHIKLQLSRDPKKQKTFKLGTYPFPCDGYGQFLAKRLQEFMRGSYEDSDRGWPQTLKYPWWQRSLLGRKKLPEDIDQRAEEWLRSQQKKTH